MEESEKRRERLKAMRMEAAKADTSIESESSGIVSHSLSNPLIENEPATSTAVQYSRPRFDYYTDPMSAFSADKRRNKFSHQVSQGYSNMPPIMTSSPQAPGGHHSQSFSLGTPMGVAGPLGKPQGNTSNSWGGSYSSLNYNYPPNMRDVNFPNPVVGQGDAPHAAVHGWGRGDRYSNSPCPQFNFHHDSPNMIDVNFPNSAAGRGDSPHAVHGWGRGGRYSNSPRPQLHSPHDSQRGSSLYSDWGRGGGLGPSARRGKDSRDPVSAELRPDLYYDKEMLEDPWKGMTPVIWKGPNSDGSWLPKSISVKKGPFPKASHKSVSQPSLAEYLATLNDTVNEPTREEHEQSEVRES